MYRKVTQGWLKHLDFIVLDLLCLHVAFVSAYMAKHGFANPYAHDSYRTIAVVFSLMDLVIVIFFNSMKDVLRRSFPKELRASLIHAGLLAVTVTFYLFSVKDSASYSRVFYYLMLVFYFFLSLLVRMGWKVVLRQEPFREKTSLFLIVSSQNARKVVEDIQKNTHGIYRLSGMAVLNRDMRGQEICGVPVTASREDVIEYLKREWVDEVLVAAPNSPVSLTAETTVTGATAATAKAATKATATTVKNAAAAIAAMEKSASASVNITSVAGAATETDISPDTRTMQALPQNTEDLYQSLIEMGLVVHIRLNGLEQYAGERQTVERIGRSTVLTYSLGSVTLGQAFAKRTIDIIGGLVGCLVTGLLYVVIAPLIYIKSPGPIFFAQTRVGRNGKKFKMYKFRSMCLDAEARKAEVAVACGLDGQMMFKFEEDPRIIGSKVLPDGTYKKGIGNFIRDTSLDEFPQFFNVLKGDMSLVGTRPPTVDEWEKYEAHHRARMSIRPGITGLWQVSGRSNISDFEEVVELDRQYISGWSIWLDLKILLKTVGVVFRQDGAM